MNQLSTHNNEDKIKEQNQISKQRQIISTRNIIPNNRPVTREDVTKFVEKRKELIAKDKVEEIKAPIVKLPQEHPDEKPEENKHIGESFDDFLKEDGIYEEVTERAKDKIDADYQEQVTGIKPKTTKKKKPGRKPKESE